MAAHDSKEANQDGRRKNSGPENGGTLPLLWGGADCGTVEAAREGLYLRFRASVPLPRKGEELWCVWLAGEAGEARLGVLEPSGGCLALTRRLSARSLASLGPLLHCEVRPVSGLEGQPAVDRPPDPDILPRPGGGVLLSYPCAGPFPLPELFCFARLERAGGQQRWLFAFDEKGKPAF